MAIDANYWDKDSHSSLQAYRQEFYRHSLRLDVLEMEVNFEKIQELFNRRQPEQWEAYKAEENLEWTMNFVRQRYRPRG